MIEETSLVERLMDSDVKKVNPFEVARKLNELYTREDNIGVRKLRDAYLIGVGRLHRKETVDEIRNIVTENLLQAATIADIVTECGYEASGQLHAATRLYGPVAKFVKEAIEYKV